MQIVMSVDISGARDGVRWPSRGGVIDLPDDEAAEMIANGFARLETADAPAAPAHAADDAPVETADAPDVETR